MFQAPPCLEASAATISGQMAASELSVCGGRGAIGTPSRREPGGGRGRHPLEQASSRPHPKEGPGPHGLWWDEANELVGPLPILGGQVGGRAYRAGLACLITPGWVVLGPQCLKENHLQTSTSSQTLSFSRMQVSLAHRHLSLGGEGTVQ